MKKRLSIIRTLNQGLKSNVTKKSPELKYPKRTLTRSRSRSVSEGDSGAERLRAKS